MNNIKKTILLEQEKLTPEEQKLFQQMLISRNPPETISKTVSSHSEETRTWTL